MLACVSPAGRAPEAMDDAESRYAIMLCSSAKTVRSSLAMYEARLEVEDEDDGIEPGGYVTARAAV